MPSTRTRKWPNVLASKPVGRRPVLIVESAGYASWNGHRLGVWEWEIDLDALPAPVVSSGSPYWGAMKLALGSGDDVPWS
jgi:hypothetical protein